MLDFLKEKWLDVYSYFDHLWWKYEDDIIWYGLVFGGVILLSILINN